MTGRAVVRLPHPKGQPLRLSALHCAACRVQGVAIVALQTAGGVERLSAWCGPACAWPAGWPFLASERPGEAAQSRLDL